MNKVRLVGDIGDRFGHEWVMNVSNYSELLQSKAEDLTIKAEDISAGYVSEKEVGISSLNTPVIENLNTATQEGSLYLSDGTEYHGSFHLHLDNGAAMTGDEHTKESQALYLSTGKITGQKMTKKYRRK